jgi:hypothetical protein
MSTKTNTGLHLAVICVGAVMIAGASVAAVTQAPRQDGPAKTHRFLPGDRAAAPKALGPVTILQLGGIDFLPIGSATYAYAGAGGVLVTTGSQFFNAGLRLPAGSRLLTVLVYINPNGAARTMTVTRYRPSNPPVFEDLASASSTNGNVVEAVLLTVNKDIPPGWNHRISNLNLSAGGAILYGAKVRYRPPA